MVVAVYEQRTNTLDEDEDFGGGAVAASLLKRSNFMSFNLVYYFLGGAGRGKEGLGLWRRSRVSGIWIDIRFIAVRLGVANKEWRG